MIFEVPTNPSHPVPYSFDTLGFYFNLICVQEDGNKALVQMYRSADNINIQYFQVSFSKRWSWHTLDECSAFSWEKQLIKWWFYHLSLSKLWQRQSQGACPFLPHSCPIPLCLCATACAPGNKFRGIPCSITWMQSNRKVTAVLSCLLHKNGFQIAPINSLLCSHSCWSSHCTNISCIDGSWHNHSSQTTTANLSELLGSAIGKHKSRAFGANLF